MNGIQEVSGSIPLISTKRNPFPKGSGFFCCAGGFNSQGYFGKLLRHISIKQSNIPKSTKFPGSQNSPGFIAEKVKLYPNINYYQPLQKACRAERLSCLEYGIHADFFRQDADGITIQRRRSMEI